LLGIKTLIVTNASGGLREDLKPGTLMAISDHINLMGTNPLIGPKDPRLGARYPDLTEAYDSEVRQAISQAGKLARVRLQEGVYAALSGPSYETPAEIRMLGLMGADAVGMSTVPEVIVANQMGVSVAGLSCIANRAAGLSLHRLSHSEVMDVTKKASKPFCRLLNHAIPLIAAVQRSEPSGRSARPSIEEQRSVGMKFKGQRKR
jgi:purine-nucleoside phosphorylase